MIFVLKWVSFEWLPWVPEVTCTGIFFRLKEGTYTAKPGTRGAKHQEEKNNLWSHEL